MWPPGRARTRSAGLWWTPPGDGAWTSRGCTAPWRWYGETATGSVSPTGTAGAPGPRHAAPWFDQVRDLFDKAGAGVALRLDRQEVYTTFLDGVRLTDILTDLSADLAQGDLLLPGQALDRFPGCEDDLSHRRWSPATSALVTDLTRLARAWVTQPALATACTPARRRPRHHGRAAARTARRRRRRRSRSPAHPAQAVDGRHRPSRRPRPSAVRPGLEPDPGDRPTATRGPAPAVPAQSPPARRRCSTVRRRTPAVSSHHGSRPTGCPPRRRDHGRQRPVGAAPRPASARRPPRRPRRRPRDGLRRPRDRLRHLTLYTLSTENWKRDGEEIGAILDILREELEDYPFQDLDVRVRWHGVRSDCRRTWSTACGCVSAPRVTARA